MSTRALCADAFHGVLFAVFAVCPKASFSATLRAPFSEISDYSNTVGLVFRGSFRVSSQLVINSVSHDPISLLSCFAL